MRYAAFGLTLLLAPTAFGSEPETVLSFRPNELQPQSSSFALSDFLQLSGGSSACQVGLGQLRLKVGELQVPRLVSRQDVTGAILHSAEWRDCPVAWSGQPWIRLPSPPGQVLDVTGLADTASQALRGALSKDYQAIKLAFVPEATANTRTVAPDARFSVVPPSVDRVARRMLVEVEVTEPGLRPWRLPLWFTVSAQREAWRAVRTIEIGQSLAMASLQKTMSDWAELGGALIPGDFDLSNSDAIRPIPAGAVLRAGDLRAHPAVASGEKVVAQASVGPVSVETPMIALQSGLVGDHILIRSDRSQATMEAVIDRSGHVEVEPWMRALMIFAASGVSLMACASAYGSSLYSPSTYQPLTSDERSFRVGDALTVLVVETSTAQNQANSTAARETNASANVTGPSKQTALGLDLKRTYSGQAATARSGNLQAEISVRVQDVAANGDLAVHGVQKITVNGDMQLIAVTGIVRPIDISSDNVVLSSRLTNAEIVYSGRGFTDRTQKESWISRLFGLFGL